ncbi:hypothetical protein A6U87_16220 [Rhizobium sp. AC44/96]|nr:hypothetical protein A6U87_16220 [Rhizobium sp. AC44/96]
MGATATLENFLDDCDLLPMPVEKHSFWTDSIFRRQPTERAHNSYITLLLFIFFQMLQHISQKIGSQAQKIRAKTTISTIESTVGACKKKPLDISTVSLQILRLGGGAAFAFFGLTALPKDTISGTKSRRTA